MSAMPAGWTELSESPRVHVAANQVQRRSDRRAELMVARRARRRWAVASGSVLVAAFSCTVVILELLH